jgi:phosphatidate cytidylyltransferase
MTKRALTLLKLRIITAMVLATGFLVGLFFLPWFGFIVFVGVVTLIGAWEWANLAGFESTGQRFLFSVLTFLVMLLVAWYTGLAEGVIYLTETRHVLLIAGAWWAVALLWVQGYPSSAVLWESRWVRAMMGWLVLVPCWLSMSYLHQENQGSLLILLVMVTVIVADTGAYFTGKALGRHKLLFQVSPGKSWEGFWGGLIACLLLALLVEIYTGFAQWIALLVIMLFTSLGSVLGDLLESMVKRHRNIKDSGSVLPGHGGMLDRIDSITAAAPIFTLGIILSGWSL